ncbi:MAG: hypothetical protein AB1631_09575 [Acidobacteriota bacterium]
MKESIDRFISNPDVRKRHETIVRAPADVVFEVAEHFDLESILLVRAIFWLRARLLGAPHARMKKGLLEGMMGIGWGRLSYTPNREVVMGAVTEPWIGEVKFRSIPPDRFAAFDEPDLVKIVWTLEAEPLGSALTRFSTETRVIATDDGARAKFKSYWRKFRIGILIIRWLTLPAVKREAERRYKVEAVRYSTR